MVPNSDTKKSKKTIEGIVAGSPIFATRSGVLFDFLSCGRQQTPISIGSELRIRRGADICAVLALVAAHHLSAKPPS